MPFCALEPAKGVNLIACASGLHDDFTLTRHALLQVPQQLVGASVPAEAGDHLVDATAAAASGSMT